MSTPWTGSLATEIALAPVATLVHALVNEPTFTYAFPEPSTIPSAVGAGPKTECEISHSSVSFENVDCIANVPVDMVTLAIAPCPEVIQAHLSPFSPVPATATGRPGAPWQRDTLVDVSDHQGVASLAVAVAVSRGDILYDAKSDYWPQLRRAARTSHHRAGIVGDQAESPAISPPLTLQESADPPRCGEAAAQVSARTPDQARRPRITLGWTRANRFAGLTPPAFAGTFFARRDRRPARTGS